MKYEVVFDGVVIGWSHLEGGDPAMGVASGQMHPNEHYTPLPGMVVDARLSVRPEGGTAFDAVGGVYLEDYSSELGPDGLQVTVQGIDSEVYRHWFPDLFRRYFGPA
jgi:hypothetical protein